MNAGTVILTGFIMLIGLGWQGYLFSEKDIEHFENEEPPPRLFAPLILSGVVLLGVFVTGIFYLADSRKPDFTFWTFLLMNGKAIVFAFLINLKSFLGPLTTAYLLSWELYSLIEYHHLKPIPFVSALAEWLFEFFPEWVSATYLVLAAFYCLAASGVETLLDRH